MSNINNQTHNLYSIKLVQDLDHEDAATVSGGALVLTSLRDGDGTRRTFNGRNRGLRNLNNADVAFAEVTNVEAMTDAMCEADAVYAMNPPAYTVSDMLALAKHIGD